MKMATAENIAGSGLKLVYLTSLNKRCGEDAIHDVFISKHEKGMHEVTYSEKVLHEVVLKICKYFNELFEGKF